ncbi:uncharacterized protein LOC110448874 [Mizuhopecten yessoensis]|uniref:uncharacterized protein LOC110448874 n=1 Tax=Mizuhopecten yessoensis TaxID=6573 RepID=UPI000B457B34|nr:uncharacterized protein LOC110448874 [Mizuhopecten yessoensis]
MRAKDRNTCCCRKHVETRMLFRRCMDFRRKVTNGNDSDENEDDNSYPVYEHLSDIVDATLCAKGQNPYHKLNCLDRKCQSCGVKTLKLLPAETNDAGNIIWERYEYKEIAVKGGGKRRKLMLIKQSTSPAEMIQYFLSMLDTFASHQFRASWQLNQLNSLKDDLPPKACLVIHDFSENYRCIEKDELQSSYFSKPEVSIHVSVIYRYGVIEYDQVDEEEIVSEILFVVSDDLTLDQHFVHRVQKEIKDHLDNIHYEVDSMIEFTDGCSAQYKSRHCMGMSSFVCSEMGYEKFQRNYFETSHAKGPQDAAGGLLKRMLDQAVMKGTTIQNGSEVYNYASKYLDKPKGGVYRRRIFRYVDEIDRSAPKTFKPVANNRKIHQIFSNKDGEILVRAHSCYSCDSCLNGLPLTCMNTDYTGTNRLIKVQAELGGPQGTVDVAENEDQDTDIKGMLTTGDIIAVFTEDVTSDYYLIKVTSPTHKLIRCTEDDWGNNFQRGSEVIEGHYFDQLDAFPLRYKLRRGKVAIVYAVAAVYILTDSTMKYNKLQLKEEEHLDILACVNVISET